MNKKLIGLIFSIIYSALFADEISVFNAGNLEAVVPYGLTESEKVILNNKHKLTRFDRKIDDTRSNIEVIDERLDGFESMLDGESRKLNLTTNQLTKLITQYKTDKLFLTELLDEKEKNKLLFQENDKIHKQNLENIKLLQFEIQKLKTTLNKLIKQIDKNYVSKEQFNELVVFINKQFASLNKEQKKQLKALKAKKKVKKTNKQLIVDAKELFQIRYFTKAIPIFEKLIKRKYKPAQCNFYLGEIWFIRKKYKDSIHYFKTSMMLYDKAKYIPTLLLHSAISFEKIKDNDNAINFYETLIDIYPDKEEASKAKEYLAKLKPKPKPKEKGKE